MNLAVSNIAWPRDQEDAAAALLEARGVRGVEIAPSAVWSDPTASSKRERLEYRRAWERRGIAIVAFQALLYGRPDLTIFSGPDARAATTDYLFRLIDLAVDLGARVLVFGSPGHRRTAGLAPREADEIAETFFRGVGRVGEHYGVQLCIEPIPRSWGCEFVTTIREGLDLVRRVDSGGFGLHLDAASAAAEPDAASVIREAGTVVAHVHASEPNLAPIGSGGVNHAAFAAALRRIGYSSWVSIEMRVADRERSIDRVDEALRHAQTAYGLT